MKKPLLFTRNSGLKLQIPFKIIIRTSLHLTAMLLPSSLLKPIQRNNTSSFWRNSFWLIALPCTRLHSNRLSLERSEALVLRVKWRCFGLKCCYSFFVMGLWTARPQFRSPCSFVNLNSIIWACDIVVDLVLFFFLHRQCLDLLGLDLLNFHK